MFTRLCAIKNKAVSLHVSDKSYKCQTNINVKILFFSHLTNLLPHLSVTKGKGKGMMKEEPKGPEVCTDPVRLTSYAVGVNIFKQGEDPKLKPPEEYPEW